MTFPIITGSIAALGILAAGCSSMVLPCFPKDRPQLVGEWRYARNPGENASVGVIGPPHPDTLDLRSDGTFTAQFSDDQLERIRRRHPGEEVGAVVQGKWRVDWFCAGDLFLPRQWLRMEPGPDHRLFSLDGDRLTLFFPGGSGCCDEQYVLMATKAGAR